jgi:hypothetical protein
VKNLSELFSGKRAAPTPPTAANSQLSKYCEAVVHQARMKERARHGKVLDHCVKNNSNVDMARHLICETDMSADAIIAVLDTAKQPKDENPNVTFLKQFIPTK